MAPALLRDPSIPVAQITERLGVSAPSSPMSPHTLLQLLLGGHQTLCRSRTLSLTGEVAFGHMLAPCGRCSHLAKMPDCLENSRQLRLLLSE